MLLLEQCTVSAGYQITELIAYNNLAQGKLVILLLFSVGPLDISWAKMNPGVHIIMKCFLPAQSTGFALATIFMNQGEASVPAGRLPVTWPTDPQQVKYTLQQKKLENRWSTPTRM